MKFLKKVFSQNIAAAPSDDEWGQTDLIYIVLPESLDPLDRGERYEDSIEVELKLSKLGYVSGGGSSLGDEKPDGSRDIEWCGIDIDTVNIEKCRVLLREHLRELGCLAGTQLQFRTGNIPLRDEFDGNAWQLDLSRSQMHPGFGV